MSGSYKGRIKATECARYKWYSIGFQGVNNAREVVKWAYKADVGDFSNQVFTIGDQYIVARLTEIKPKGTLALANVKKQIQPAVLIAAKGKMLSDKLQTALNGSSALAQVAQKAGTQVLSVQNLVFANPVIPGASAEYKVVGTVFGSQPGKLSKPIEGQTAVYVFSVDNFIKPAPLANAAARETANGPGAVTARAIAGAGSTER